MLHIHDKQSNRGQSFDFGSSSLIKRMWRLNVWFPPDALSIPKIKELSEESMKTYSKCSATRWHPGIYGKLTLCS